MAHDLEARSDRAQTGWQAVAPVNAAPPKAGELVLVCIHAGTLRQSVAAVKASLRLCVGSGWSWIMGLMRVSASRRKSAVPLALGAVCDAVAAYRARRGVTVRGVVDVGRRGRSNRFGYR